MLYGLLENLVTSKMNVDNAIADQISLIISFLREYNKNALFDDETRKKRSIFLEYKVSNKAKEILCNCNKNPRSGIKSFFPKNFEKDIDKDQKNTLLNAMGLCNDKNMIIKLFEDKNIKPSDYPYNAKSEELEKSQNQNQNQNQNKNRSQNLKKV